MSESDVPDKVVRQLWGKAAGRCQYDGCNRPLWRDSLTKAEFNVAYVAHIVADSPGGPRGDLTLSPQLAKDPSNVMLMCDEHHRLVDKIDVEGHPIARLQQMKAKHENRVELLTDIRVRKESHVLFYGANIGHHGTPLVKEGAYQAMAPDHYPAAAPVELGTANSALSERDEPFWAAEEAQLRTAFQSRVATIVGTGEVEHLSVFALAPQPLLMLLGHLIGDKTPTEVHQLKKEPAGWGWEDSGPGALEYSAPTDASGAKKALIIGVSANIDPKRITTALGGEASIWTLSADQPHNDYLRSRVQAQQFRQLARKALADVLASSKRGEVLHVFPAMPVALAVEFGRVHNGKADLELRVWDEDRASGGFRRALSIGDLKKKDSR